MTCDLPTFLLSQNYMSYFHHVLGGQCKMQYFEYHKQNLHSVKTDKSPCFHIKSSYHSERPISKRNTKHPTKILLQF